MMATIKETGALNCVRIAHLLGKEPLDFIFIEDVVVEFAAIPELLSLRDIPAIKRSVLVEQVKALHSRVLNLARN